MTICPKCSYSLVFLEKRLRYKCAKCGRLFLQSFIDNREFRRFNEKQREFTKEEIERESQRNFEESWSAYKNLYKPAKLKKQKPVKEKRPKLTEEERKQKKKENDERYYYQNREKIILQKKFWRQRNKEHHKGWKKQHRLEQLGKIRQQDRIQFWRKQQKALALRMLENEQYKASKPETPTSVSTYSLAQLLFFCQE